MNELYPSYVVGQLLYRATATTGEYAFYAEWEVTKVTEKGAWITPKTYFTRDEKKWVSATTRFVSRSQEEALARLIRRTESWVRHAKHKLGKAEERLTNLTRGPKVLPLLHIGSTSFSGYEP
jgi:predicted NUDIX family NTP pyrophosphohydrolase